VCDKNVARVHHDARCVSHERLEHDLRHALTERTSSTEQDGTFLRRDSATQRCWSPSRWPSCVSKQTETK